MKLLKIFSISSFAFLLLVVSSPILAAGTATSTTVPSTVVVSTINIKNTKVLSQSGNSVKISFDIINSGNSQAGLKYSVRLVRETSKGQILVDEKNFPDVLSISTNSTINKTFDYVIPTGLVGDYSVLVSLSSNSGLPLGLGLAGKINFKANPKPTPDNTTVQIQNDTCYLSVAGEKGNIKYTLEQGVDISSSENLNLTCTVSNPLKTTISITPSFETYYRDLSGAKVEQEGGSTEVLSLKSLEKKTITLNLPKTKQSQAYDVKTMFSSNGLSSNSVVAHYIIRGESATIQSLSLDKDYYKKNDNANISIFWTQAADIFPGSRAGKSTVIPSVTLYTTLTDDKSQACISPISQPLDKNSLKEKITLVIPVVANCMNPQVNVQIKDVKGNILDQKNFSFKTNVQTASNSSNMAIIFTIFSVLVVVGLGVYFINLKKKSNEKNIK